eukprot:TRINITY_DN19528_c0_g1_i1.p3 TRINITY_DN19528_c0_g1~~TRINITY_DN19528_c0_g1_i1.p3  ORF type:complete len:223 (+),score=23.45 TRINITY_DN19528_c0_g1_i1:274-942(+)
MVHEANNLGEKASDVGLYVPFLLQKLFVVDGVGADDPVEVSQLVGSVEVVDRRAVEERKGNGANDLGSAQFLQVLHALDEGPASPDHVIGHKDRLAFDVAQQPHLLDIGVGGVFADLRVIPFLIEEGERPLEGVGVELVPVDGTRIRGQNDEVFRLYVDDGHELLDDLEGGVEVLEAQLVEAVFDLARVNIESDDPGHAEVFKHGADAGRGQAFPPLLLVLA